MEMDKSKYQTKLSIHAVVVRQKNEVISNEANKAKRRKQANSDGKPKDFQANERPESGGGQNQGKLVLATF